MSSQREVVARMVDHEGYWERMDGLDVALALGHITADQRADLERVRAEEVRGTAESLTKADAILSAIQPTVTEAAVEAGALAIRPHVFGINTVGFWQTRAQDEARRTARAALTAALPFITGDKT